MKLVEASFCLVIHFLSDPVLKGRFRFRGVAQLAELHGYIRFIRICYYCALIRPDIALILPYELVIVALQLLLTFAFFSRNRF